MHEFILGEKMIYTAYTLGQQMAEFKVLHTWVKLCGPMTNIMRLG